MKYSLFIAVLAWFTILSAACVTSRSAAGLGKNSSGRFQITVDLEKQRTKVFFDDKLIKDFPCSTAIDGKSTPIGHFKTCSHKEADYIMVDNKRIDFYYKTEFSGHIGFHSKIYGDHPMVKKGEELLHAGKPSSAGCIRLEKSAAKWIYHLPLGVLVYIQ